MIVILHGSLRVTFLLSAIVVLGEYWRRGQWIAVFWLVGEARLISFIPILGTRSQPRRPIMTAQESVAEGTVHGRFHSRLIVRC